MLILPVLLSSYAVVFLPVLLSSYAVVFLPVVSVSCCLSVLFSLCPVVFMSYLLSFVQCHAMCHTCPCCYSVLLSFCVVICHAMCPTCPHNSVVFLSCCLCDLLSFFFVFFQSFYCQLFLYHDLWYYDVFFNNHNLLTSTPEARDAIASKNYRLKHVFIVFFSSNQTAPWIKHSIVCKMYDL